MGIADLILEELYAGADTDRDGHALCMVRWTERPRGFDCHTVESSETAVDGNPVHSGYHVPIDYEVVGGSSSAVKRGWILRDFYTPERIYGTVM